MRFFFVWLVLFSGISERAIAEMGDYHAQGMAIGQSLKDNKPSSPKDTPGFSGDNVPESRYTEQTLSESIKSASLENDKSAFIFESSDKRPRFNFNPENDSFFKNGDEFIKDPLRTLSEEATVESITDEETVKKTIKKCEEGGEDYQKRCSKRLHVKLDVIPEKTEIRRFCPGHPRKRRSGLHYKHWTHYCPGGCQSKTVLTQQKQVVVAEEYWIDGCQILEEKTEKGRCSYVSKTTSPKNETRIIDGEPVTRDHFEEYFVYECSYPVKKSCSSLRAKGCEQINSKCKKEIKGICVLWEQTYECRKSKVLDQTKISGKGIPYCLDGDCTSHSFSPNSDMADSLSKLAIFQKIQKDMDSTNHKVFKGNPQKCSRLITSFEDCCVLKGWGVNVGLASCDEEDKKLAEQRKLNRCIRVGTYCAVKELGVCIRKKTTFCCYQSKIARLIHEQGRKQLGLNFGTPKFPTCDGLSLEQITKLDFSKIDFSELFTDIVSNTKVPNVNHLTQDIQQSMEGRVKSSQTQTASSVQGRENGSF